MSNFGALIDAVADRFPESPPYEGKYDNVIPHLTVAHFDDSLDIDPLRDSLAALTEGVLPIAATVEKITLIEKINGSWRERTSFPLAA